MIVLDKPFLMPALQPTDAQRDYMKRLKVTETPKTKQEASQLIDKYRAALKQASE